MFSFCDLEKDKNRVSVFQAHLEAAPLDFSHSPAAAEDRSSAAPCSQTEELHLTNTHNPLKNWIN